MEEKLKIASFLAAAAIGLFFTTGFIANHYGPKVSDRFLERGQAYGEADLKHLRPKDARGYVFPVLFPLDLAFMIFLGGFLGLASMACAELIEPLKNMTWLFAIGPALYVALDLIEDILISRMLLSLAATRHMIDLAQSATKAKIVTCSYGILQTMALSSAAVLSA